MKPIEIDRRGWGEGLWDGEPDRVEFEHSGLPCLIQRSKASGAWCGYVAVPPGHPAHGKGYDDLPGIEVHGGLTYANKCSEHICHIPKPGEPDNVHWFGFDCAHGGDLMPAMNAVMRRAGIQPSEEWEIYKGVPYVTEETKRLAEQLAVMK